MTNPDEIFLKIQMHQDLTRVSPRIFLKIQHVYGQKMTP